MAIPSLKCRLGYGTDGGKMARVQDRRIFTGIEEKRWAALEARDVTADGQFVYAVKTTGVYCRPSCGARRPRPENVIFFETGESAREAGFRACRRCRPDALEGTAEMVAGLCRMIAAADAMPPLQDLASHCGLSRFQLIRLFKARTGLTPHAYAASVRAARVRAELRGKEAVTQAIYASGFGSAAHFYREADGMLGMTPANYQARGGKQTIRFAMGLCSLGSILVAATGRGICAIFLGSDPDRLLRDLQDEFSDAQLVGGDAAFEQHVARVIGFVEAPGIGLDLPLDIRGTAFQQRVWQALQKIPAGETLSYTELARRVGAPRSVRAVAGACAANLLAVAIPCHRVVRLNGALSGYRWGIERKHALLEREVVQAEDHDS